MTNDEFKKEVLSRALRWKKNKTKRNKRILVGSVGLLCLSLSILLFPTFTIPPTITTPVNDIQATTPFITHTETSHFTTQAVSTATIASQIATTRTETKHSNKSPYPPFSTTIASIPPSDSILVLEGSTVYRLATKEEYSQYDIPQTIRDENIGKYLGIVETRSDAPIYSVDPTLTGGRVYTYKPVADKMMLVILCNEKTFVFIVSR